LNVRLILPDYTSSAKKMRLFRLEKGASHT